MPSAKYTDYYECAPPPSCPIKYSYCVTQNSVCRIAEFDRLKTWVLFLCQGESEDQKELH
jgi:hypothetical protein